MKRCAIGDNFEEGKSQVITTENEPDTGINNNKYNRKE
jgi:hypothetical protein